MNENEANERIFGLDKRLIELNKRLDKVDIMMARQLRESIERNARMVNRIKALIVQIAPLTDDPDMEDLIEDLQNILNDKDPSPGTGP